MIHASSSSLNYPLLRASWIQSPLNLLSRRTTGCWCCDSSHPPHRVACSSSSSTVQINHCCQMPDQSSVIACTADDWDRQCKWSWSGLYLIAMYSRRSDHDQMLIRNQCYSCIYNCHSQLPTVHFHGNIAQCANIEISSLTKLLHMNTHNTT